MIAGWWFPSPKIGQKLSADQHELTVNNRQRLGGLRKDSSPFYSVKLNITPRYIQYGLLPKRSGRTSKSMMLWYKVHLSEEFRVRLKQSPLLQSHLINGESRSELKRALDKHLATAIELKRLFIHAKQTHAAKISALIVASLHLLVSFLLSSCSSKIICSLFGSPNLLFIPKSTCSNSARHECSYGESRNVAKSAALLSWV